MSDKLGYNRHKRAERKRPHHRVALMRFQQRTATGWESMLMVLFKVGLNLENVLKV